MSRGYQLETWTNDRVDRLTAMVADGCTAAQIAVDLGRGLTRNAIIGKASRLGLRLKGVGGRNKGRKPKANGLPNALRAAVARKQKGKATPKPATIHYLQAVEATDLPDDESPFACTLMDLTHKTCRWPLGDPLTPEFRFCGADKFGEQSYCARHCRLSYQPYQRRERPRPQASPRA